jgi:Na+/H+ antiporter NhaD/arsenite permease-like protein
MIAFGVMIVVANLRLSGFFSVNGTMCLVLTSLVLEVSRQLRRNSVPYLLAVAMAANAGSVATITGKPQGNRYRSATLG